MKLVKKFLVLICSLLVCANVFAAPFKQIIMLGDSLSDNGNLYRADLGVLPKSPPYYLGRFTNGPTWVEHVGQYYYNKYLVETQNYAYGGATAVIHNPLHDLFPSPMLLDGEMVSYGFHSILKDKSKVLYIVWIGANDYLYDKTPNVDGLTGRVVDKISATITSLIKQHGQDFLILNLPDMGKTPYARANGMVDSLHAISEMHNRKLANMVNNFKNRYPGVKFVTVDVYSIFDDLVKNPAKYNAQYGKNIANMTDACWTGGFALAANGNMSIAKNNLDSELQQAVVKANFKNFDGGTLSEMISNSPVLMQSYKVAASYAAGGTRCANPDANIFWDELHPSAVVHDILGKIVIKTLTDAGQG